MHVCAPCLRDRASRVSTGGDQGPDKCESVTGLPLATYFSGPKIRWLLDNVDGVRARAEGGDLLFGTTDSWLLWNMTGGPDGGVHITDVTNAYGTGNFMLMNTGTQIMDSANGLLTTVGYRIGEAEPVYALEGSVAVTGSLVQWSRDNLGPDQFGPGGGGPGQDCGRQRRGLLRTGLLRVVRALLATRYPRGAGGDDPVREQGPPRPGSAGIHRVPDP